MNADAAPNPVEWLDEHGDYLFRYAYVRVRDNATAEDMVQETFLAGIQALERYDGKTPVRYWLRGILRHKIIDYIRRSSREITVDDTEDSEILDSLKFKAFGIPTRTPPPWAFSPAKAYEHKEFWGVFYHCLAHLTDTMGRAFTLRELEGVSTKDICKELDLKPNNLWVVLHRARMQLKACLEKHWTAD